MASSTDGPPASPTESVEGLLQGEALLEDGLDEEDDELDARTPREKLQNVGVQAWALFFGMLSLLLAAYGLHAPLSCVNYTDEEARMPQKCRGLHDTGLMLPDFCWRACSWGTRKLEMAGWQLLGLLFQTVVVILHSPGCHHFLRFVWYFDPREHVEALHKEVAEQSGAKNFVLHPINSMKTYARHTAESKVKKTARDMAKQAATQRVQALACSRAASKASRACLAVAFFRLSMLAFAEYSHMTVFFECSGGDGETVRVEREPERRLDLIPPLGVAWLCLGMALVLGLRAQWRISVTVRTKSAQELRGTLSKTKFGFFAKSFEDTKDVNKDLSKRYSNLRAVALHQLCHVRYNGRCIRPDDLDAWNWDNKDQGEGLVDLRFIPKKKNKKLLEMENWHRKFAMLALGFACFLLFVASSSCWSCVKGVRAPEDTSHLHLDKWLLLMGSCGRHADVGMRCLLGCVLLFLSLAQQLVIFKCCEQGIDSLEELGKNHRRQQLMLPIVDYRKVRVLDGEHYEKAGAELPKLKCHVWVDLDTPGDEPAPVHFESFQNQSGKTKSWDRSEEQRLVNLTIHKIPQVPDWKAKLHRDDTSMPSVHIDFWDEKSRTMCHQIVPPEFVTGFFHAWVNLGPKLAWEKMSAFLAFFGACLGGYDIAVFELSKHGRHLTSCGDVMNSGRCIYMGLHNADESPFEFRRSVGMFVAAVACLFAAMGVLGLRVAREEPRANGCYCIIAYVRALIYSFFVLPYQMIRTAAGALCYCCAPAKASRRKVNTDFDYEQRLLEAQGAQE